MNMEVSFTSRRELAQDVWEYFFVAPEPLDFVPGQYAKFWFSNNTSLGGRTFTLTSRPGDTIVSFIVRFPNPMSDYKQRLTSISVGELLKHEQPMGDAILPRQNSAPLIFVAQGIGIASYISILRECKEKALPFTLHIFWTRRESDAPLQMCFESFITEYVALHRFDSSTRLTYKDIMPTAFENSIVYLAGSQSFVETIGAQLEDQGILRERMIYDYYEGYVTL